MAVSTSGLHWRCLALDALSARELHALLRLRSEVFVVEQRCIYLDPDALDLEALHLWACDEAGTLLACARLIPADAGPKIGRVLTAPTARGSGLGRELMRHAIAECDARWPGLAISLSAQAHLQHFYAGLGFAPISEVYDEDGIPHIDMRKASET